MTEFWIMSNFFREKCDENAETQILCKKIAAKHMECEKKELRAQSAREENITMKLDVGNLESLCRTVIENDETQAELHSLLKKYYEEHLRVTFDIDECEIEKLYSYEEIKIELETRESVGVYQQFYCRKIKMATKMEERKIVKNYRQKERELLDTLNERLKLEEAIKKLQDKAEEVRARTLEMHKRIYRLVKGSKDLEAIYSCQKLHKYGSQSEKLKLSDKGHLCGAIEKTEAPHQIPHKGGLSSRLLLDFNQFKTPCVPVLPKIHTINPTMGLSRLLKQAEVLRKSMQRNVIAVSNDPPTPKLSSILKMPTEFAKLPESCHKTVSFETDIPQDIAISNSIPDATPSTPQITLDTTVSQITIDSELKKDLLENTKAGQNKIEILENVIIEPAETPLPIQLPVQLSREEHPKPLTDSKTNKKRKATDEDHRYVRNSSPPKKNRGDTIDKLDNSIGIGSKSFMDMFLDLSKETSTVSPSIAEPKEKAIVSDTKEPTKKIKEDVKKDTKTESIKDNKKTAKNPKVAFDDFDDFFSGFAGNGSDNNDNDHSGGEMSFDFFDGNENADNNGDAGSDSFSFKF